MTLAAPKSRQGKFILVLAFLAATVAVLGALVWANTAQADIPADATVTFSSTPATVAVGGAVSYTATVDITTAPPNVTTNTTLEWNTDPNLVPVSAPNATGAPWSSGECSNGTNFYGTLRCVDATGPAADATVQVGYVALPVFDFNLESPASQSTSTPQVCALFDDGTVWSGNCTDQGVFGSIDPWIVTGSGTTNTPNTQHLITFTLPVGVTCESDVNLNDGLRSCTTADTVFADSPVATIVNVGPSPVVNTSNLNAPSTVDVTINSAQAATVTITLLLKYDTQGTVGTAGNAVQEIDLIDPTATKTYGVLNGGVAGATGEIRHLDEADQAAEDAADSDINQLDPYCAAQSVPVFDCGILVAQDDADDAVGSFHQACIINSNLTHAGDSGFITWDIAPGPGSNATVNPGPSGQKVAGPLPNEEPCVRWGSAGTGSQTITATYDNGIDPSILFLWSNGTTPLPLVKEWNDIDSTKIVLASGTVGGDLTQNSSPSDLSDWDNRDCSFDPPAPSAANLGFCDDPNVDTLTLGVEATLIITTPQLFLTALPKSFIEYTMGSHSDLGGSYDGPIDGVSQTFTISGDCGSVRVENPQTGTSVTLANNNGQLPTSTTVLSSDKGVGFTFVPNNQGSLVTTTALGADCGPSDTICIGITTIEANLFDSGPLQTVPQEDVCVTYSVGPLTAKTPQLAWAGQRVVLSNDWSAVIDCTATSGSFYVLYSVQAGPGSFTAALQGSLAVVSQTGQDAIVEVAFDGTNCTSNVIFENQDQAQNDIIAYIVIGPDFTVPTLSNAQPVSQQVPFVIYYLKFEDATLTLVPGTRADHNDGAFTPNGPFDSSTDVTEMTGVNVSADVLARLRVRGWVTTTNCPVRDSGTGANGEFLPANRCIFPDDWRFKAGGGVGDSLNNPATVAGFAEESRPNFDNAGGGTLGVINAWDAPMAPALARFALADSGFLRPTDKDDVYSPATNNNPFYTAMIPASTFIAPINADLSGYLWNSWGVGSKSGPYNFWTSLADSSAEVVSCAGPSSGVHWDPTTGTETPSCGDGSAVLTGGYSMTKVYTDNHGEAMTWINGDANLSFLECTSSASSAGHMIVLLSGYYCEKDDVVGDSTLSGSVDYPDKKKHFAIQSGDVTIEWTWGGIKEVNVVAGASAQFNYVVFHVTDRDGECRAFNNGAGQKTLHSVLGEQVTFTIDSPNGIIFPDANGIPAALLGTWTTKTADVTTFDANVTNALTIAPTLDVEECQAWIHITESLLGPVNVIVTAFDPEGTVTFDKIINPITAPPTAPPTTPPPATQQNLWADIDCSNNVNPIDSLKMLRADAGLSVSQQANCPAPSTSLDVTWGTAVQTTTTEKWADSDCSGSLNPVDSLKVLRFDAGLTNIQQEPCPDIGSEVLIPQQ